MQEDEEKIDRRKVLDGVNWDFIARQHGSRSHLQCCDHWYNKLAPTMIEAGIWGEGDDRRLLKALLACDLIEVSCLYPAWPASGLMLDSCVVIEEDMRVWSGWGILDCDGAVIKVQTRCATSKRMFSGLRLLDALLGFNATGVTNIRRRDND